MRSIFKNTNAYRIDSDCPSQIGELIQFGDLELASKYNDMYLGFAWQFYDGRTIKQSLNWSNAILIWLNSFTTNMHPSHRTNWNKQCVVSQLQMGVNLNWKNEPYQLKINFLVFAIDSMNSMNSKFEQATLRVRTMGSTSSCFIELRASDTMCTYFMVYFYQFKLIIFKKDYFLV